jgi:Pyruvate/2-oxoacid:ferredoxin oxidoreductase delta subunit
MQIIQIELPPVSKQNAQQSKAKAIAGRISALLCAFGLLLLCVGYHPDFYANQPVNYMLAALCLPALAALIVIFTAHKDKSPIITVLSESITQKGVAAWGLSVFLTGFYTILYWFPENLQHILPAVQPLSKALTGQPPDHWFLYGTLYTLLIAIMGIRMLLRYRHSRYQTIRTISLIFFQFLFAWLIPALLKGMQQPEFYFTYFWPLKYNYLFPADIQWLAAQPGGLSIFFVYWTIIASFIAVPVLTWLYGKRWYCSWVCGCGGLAETLGDPWRQHALEQPIWWKVEKVSIYSILGLISILTLTLWMQEYLPPSLHPSVQQIKQWYGFIIGGVFSGVAGVGFYPLLGGRIWCRFGCPQAAILGILQKYFSRFQISSNGSQCISCGNCTVYCEMGIDVRSYAQQGQIIKRASCVGCGICQEVCPRGVLKLENKKWNKKH